MYFASSLLFVCVSHLFWLFSHRYTHTHITVKEMAKFVVAIACDGCGLEALLNSSPTWMCE